MNLTRLLKSIQSWDRISNRCIGDDVSVACPPEIASYTLDILLINIDCDIVFHASLILLKWFMQIWHHQVVKRSLKACGNLKTLVYKFEPSPSKESNSLQYGP